jgi:tRNA-specific 2-thiouridylase
MKDKHKALALISGGLDSMLAARVIQEQGIRVEALNFYTGFCVEGHTSAIRQRDRKRVRRNNALWVAEQLGVRVHIVDVVEEYKEVVINPKHGYGANLNPCLDCKVFMVRKAVQWMCKHGSDFVITGEVIGQRPKSQLKGAMCVVADESGARDLLLRPLCAKNLPLTLPEREGWVDRARLHDFSGRSRKPQIALAARFEVEDYAQPAGGCCFLTDRRYASKLEDLWRTRGTREYALDDVMLLKVGRHLRPRPHFKLIIAREDGECRFLEGYRRQFTHLRALSHQGPLSLVDGPMTDDDEELAACLAARFGQGRGAPQVTIEVCRPDGTAGTLEVQPMPPERIPEEWYV